jgi:hypothetical protein
MSDDPGGDLDGAGFAGMVPRLDDLAARLAAVSVDARALRRGIDRLAGSSARHFAALQRFVRRQAAEAKREAQAQQRRRAFKVVK